jgi:hypothetical protein
VLAGREEAEDEQQAAMEGNGEAVEEEIERGDWTDEVHGVTDGQVTEAATEKAESKGTQGA